MKTRMLLLTVVALCTTTIHAQAGDPAQNRNQGGNAGTVVSELTAAEIENILHMREEEKLARDVYLTLAEMWDCPVFSNIAVSEQRHMDAVGLLIAKYGLEDPIEDDTLGVFASSEFAGWFDTLTIDGAGSLLKALSVGVTIEEMDIQDLEEALGETEAADVEWVFENLQRGSYNHLRAFTRNIASGGTACTLQGAGNGFGTGLANDEMAGKGRGRGGRGSGQGKGRGYGNGNRRGGGGSGDGTCNPDCPQNGQQQQGPSGSRQRDGSCIVEEEV